MATPSILSSRVRTSGGPPPPPGPRGWPVVGVAPLIARDPYGAFRALAREHGDVVSVPVPGMKLVLVSHPDHVKHITNKHHDAYPKPELFRQVLFRDTPNFHGMANGDDWKRVRRTLNPKFGARGLAPLEGQMIDAIVDTIDGWERFARSGEVVDLQEQLSLVTMAVLLRSMFSREAPREELEGLADKYVRLMHGMAMSMYTTPLPGWAPRPHERRYEQVKREIFAYIDAMIAERRREAAERDDVLSLLLGAEFDDGSRMTDEHLRRELLGLIFGGYETTAAVMSWVLAQLPFAPEAQARAHEEVDALGGRRIDAEALKELVWVRACFDEAQRLQAFPLNAREATLDDEIGGYAIPAGTTVAFSGEVLHRDPRWWREPDRFLPQRFLEDEIEPYAFLPFGMGPRRCLGTRMAYMVGPWTLAAALQRYRFELPAGWTPHRKFVFSTTVKGGLPARIRRR